MMVKKYSGLSALLPLALLAAACVSPNPDYCDETRPCTDEAKPFCDLEGTYEASNFTAHACIPDPRTSDGGTSDTAVDAGADSSLGDDQGQADATADSLGPAKLTSETTQHDFGSVSQGGQSALATVTVKNSGPVPAGKITTALSGPNADELVIVQDDCAQAELDADETCDVQLRLAPTSIGTKEARLDLSADPGGSLSIALSGTGAAPAALQLKTTLYNFGTVTGGATSDSQVFSVRNDGDVASGTIEVSCDEAEHYVLSQNDCGGALAPGASCDVKVAFAPNSAGKHNATLIIEADPGGRTTAALSGTGKVAVSVTLGGTGQGSVTSVPAGIDCGTTCSADFTTATVTLTAEAQGDSCFVGWSKACAGRGATCTLTLDQAKTVQADFNKPAVLFTLKTTATGSAAPFDPEVKKGGCALTWDFGDGSPRVTANRVSHIYAAAGEKTVTVFSPDGGAQVTSINIDRDELTGEIPAALGNLSNLEFLDLSVNELTGEIPAALGNLSSLEFLILGANELTGRIPVALGNLSSLEGLYLYTNQLTGGIPVALGNLSSLESLNLWSNELTGGIPAELGNLPKLNLLYLGSNTITGVAPEVFNRLTAITSVSLGDATLTQPMVDAIVDQIYEARDSYGNTQTKTLYLDGGTNASPSAAAMAKIHELKTDTYKWDIRHN